jgi:hypothetical protein
LCPQFDVCPADALNTLSESTKLEALQIEKSRDTTAVMSERIEPTVAINE